MEERTNMTNRKRFPKYFVASIRTLFILSTYLLSSLVYLFLLTILLATKIVYSAFYNKCESILSTWMMTMIAACIYSAGYDIQETGDDISNCLDKYTLAIVNHTTEADLTLLIANFISKPNVAPKVMYLGARKLKRNLYGVMCQMRGDFFISAGKERRQASLKSFRDHLEVFFKASERKWIVMFPEGGRLHRLKLISQKFALKNDLPHLEHVALPRIGAMKIILDTLCANDNNKSNYLEYVLDITILYPKGNPLRLSDILFGIRDPCVTRMHYKIYKIEEVPKEEELLKAWLYERFYEKEQLLKEHYKTGGETMERLIHQNNLKLFLTLHISAAFLYFLLFRFILKLKLPLM